MADNENRHETAPRRKKWPWILACVLILAAVLAGGLYYVLYGSPRARLGRAIAATAEQIQTEAEQTPLQDLRSLLSTGKFSLSGSLEMDSVTLNKLDWKIPLPENMGLRGGISADLPDRNLTGSATLYAPSGDLISAYVGAQDETMTIFSPELLDRSALKLNTVTLGQDLQRLESPEEAWDLSFRLFDLLDLSEMLTRAEQGKYLGLLRDVEVSKLPDTPMQINGYAVSCQPYMVEIPAEAAADTLGSWADALSAGDFLQLTADEEKETPLGASVRRCIAAGLRSMEQTVRAENSLSLKVCTHDGIILAVIWQGPEPADDQVMVFLGGGERLLDDLGARVQTDGNALNIASRGSHTAADGPFTDSTAISCTDDSGRRSLSSELQWNPEKPEDNFAWNLSGSKEMEMTGTLQTSPRKCVLTLDRVTAVQPELNLNMTGSLTAEYLVPAEIPAADLLDLSTMTPDDMQALQEQMKENIKTWQEKLIQDFLSYLGLDFGR